jgi:23S rRNA pseudouridine2604 synthase
MCSIKEGKKRQIRRMCEKLEHHVTELKRIRIMNIELGNLASGKCRKIEEAELSEFLREIGIN